MSPDHFITPLRQLVLPEIHFFHVANQPTGFANLDRDLDILLDSLYAAKALANLGEMGPDITRYYPVEDPAGGPGLYRMEVGIAVKPDVQPAGAAAIKILPAYACAGVLLWGGLPHLGEAYTALKQAIETEGIRTTSETREITYSFEAVDSPNNLMGIYMQIQIEF